MAPPLSTQVGKSVDSLMGVLYREDKKLSAIEINGHRYEFKHFDTLQEYQRKAGFDDPAYLKLKHLADNVENKSHT